MRHSSKIILALAAASFMVAGCESDQEKAERELYSLDNAEVAKAFNTYIWDNGKPYRDISKECQNEKLHKINDGKWCAKFKMVDDEVNRQVISSVKNLSEPDWGGGKNKKNSTKK